MRSPEEVFKVVELSDRIQSIIEAQSRNDEDSLTQSDLQGAIEAVIMNAIDYGRKGK